MAEAGYRVVPFCPDPHDLEKRLQENHTSPEVLRRISKPLKQLGPAPTKRIREKWGWRLEAYRFFGGIGRALRAWERANSGKIGLVFFACIYDRHFEYFRQAEWLFRFPWAGLYLHARSFRLPGSPVPYLGGLPCPEKIFNSPNIRLVGVLDEHAVEPLKKITCGKPVCVFPDITCEKMPEEWSGTGLAYKVKSFAKGRPIVSLTGHLQWTKGLDLFTQAAGHSGMSEVFFFLSGEINWSEIPIEEKTKLQAEWERLPNLYAHLQQLPEPTMNSVYAISDVVVAAYRRFPNSSNALTKAAVWERPIVVCDGYLMAERVKKFGLGEVIPESSAEALVVALKRMLTSGYYDKLRIRARWEEYRKEHSVARLKKIMKEKLFQNE